MKAYLGAAALAVTATLVISAAGGGGAVFARQRSQCPYDVQQKKAGHGEMMGMDKGQRGMMMQSGKEVILKGEVLDMYCFMNHPETGQGADHAKCARSCIDKGLPIGFLSGGDVYLLLGAEHESASRMVADFAGVQSLITGRLIEHHGVKAIEVSAIAKAEPSK